MSQLELFGRDATARDLIEDRDRIRCPIDGSESRYVGKPGRGCWQCCRCGLVFDRGVMPPRKVAKTSCVSYDGTQETKRAPSVGALGARDSIGSTGNRDDAGAGTER
jgi:ribosomal protein L37AE/L43A